MGAQDRIRLGADGVYRLVGEEAAIEDASGSVGDAGSDDCFGGVKRSAGSMAHDPKILTTISSSMSGPGIGDEVAARRASLLYAKGEPKVGRRESPEPYDPRPKRIMYAKGIAAGLAVVVLVAAVVVILGSGSSIG